MNRGVFFGCVALLAAVGATAAAAQTPLERGRYLVDTVMTCHNCHTPMGPNGPQFDKALSGGLRFDEPPFDVTASNITPHAETGIGKWSDADIKKALLEGVRPTGHRLAEVMPSGYYNILTPGDLDGIVAYLRSLPPVANKVRDPVYKMNIPHQVFPDAEKPMPEADLNDKVKRGFYLVTIAHCMECHTPFGPPGTGVDFQNSLGKGGREFHGPWGVLRMERRRDQTRHHPGRAQGRQQAQAADGLSLLRQDDRRRPRRHGRLSAHGAGEGVSQR
jgi:mono/diheme cytochrome c family protein